MQPTCLENIWNACYESMLIIERNGQLVNANRSAMRLFTLASGNIQSTSFFELAPFELQKLFSTFEKRTGISFLYGTKELLMNIVPIEHLFLVIIKDITYQQQLKYELQQANEQKLLFHSILDMLEEGVCVITIEGKIIFYNKKMGEIDLREPETVVNKLIKEAFPTIEEESSTIMKTLKHSKPLHYRGTHFRNNGKPLITLSKTNPLKIGTRQIGAVEVIKDITKQKELEETIRSIDNGVPTKASPKASNRKNNTRFTFSHIVYTSTAMRKTVDQARRAARTSSSILLIGDTGTGKELFAQSIHNESSRKDFPFVAQNCAAVPEHLLEGLLFGTTAGSFTGAVDREGLIEQAEKGTLLLDEINSMGLNLQAKLLRFLQERHIQRLGAKKSTEVDIRVIATINEDPYTAVEKGRLREDLYYRLSVVNLIITPLKARKDDIPVLINHFIKKHSQKLQIPVEKIAPEVMDLLLHYGWPGNARELEHTIEGCINMLDEEKSIMLHHLPPTFQERAYKYEESSGRVDTSQAGLPNIGLEEQLEKLEVHLIKKALQETNGNVTKAGELLRISRQRLNYKIKKYCLNKRLIF